MCISGGLHTESDSEPHPEGGGIAKVAAGRRLGGSYIRMVVSMMLAYCSLFNWFQISTGMAFAAWLVRMRCPFGGSSIARDFNLVSFQWGPHTGTLANESMVPFRSLAVISHLRFRPPEW